MILGDNVMLLRDYEVAEFQNAQHNNRRATKFQTGYTLIMQRQFFYLFFLLRKNGEKVGAV